MRKRITAISIIAAAALVLGGFYLWYIHHYGGSELNLIPMSAVDYDYAKTASQQGIVSDYLWMRTKQLMAGSGSSDVLIPESYMISGRLSYQEEVISDENLLSDQALFLMMYVKSGDRINAVSLKNQILLEYSFEEERNYELSQFLDAYLYYYDSYGSRNDYEVIRDIVEILFDEEGDLREETLEVARYEQGGFYSTDEIGDGSYSPLESMGVASSESDTVTGIEISSVNLRLIENLENSNLLPEGSLERNLEMVLDSQVSEEIPLYAYAVSEGRYIYSHDVAAAVDVEESTVTMRHLSEIGQLPEKSLSWLRMQMLNGGALCREYYYSMGATDGAEAVDIYPDIMHIALQERDPDLYGCMCRIISPRVATYQDSPALSMIFRQEDSRFVFYARENLDICLAVT